MLNLTESAQAAVSRFMAGAEEPVVGLRIEVTSGGCSCLQYSMALVQASEAEDTIVECGAVKVYVDPESMPLLEGVTVDFLDWMEDSGFKFVNPNATRTCWCGSSFSC